MAWLSLRQRLESSTLFAALVRDASVANGVPLHSYELEAAPTNAGGGRALDASNVVIPQLERRTLASLFSVRVAPTRVAELHLLQLDLGAIVSGCVFVAQYLLTARFSLPALAAALTDPAGDALRPRLRLRLMRLADRLALRDERRLQPEKGSIMRWPLPEAQPTLRVHLHAIADRDVPTAGGGSADGRGVGVDDAFASATGTSRAAVRRALRRAVGSVDAVHGRDDFGEADDDDDDDDGDDHDRASAAAAGADAGRTSTRAAPARLDVDVVSLTTISQRALHVIEHMASAKRGACALRACMRVGVHTRTPLTAPLCCMQAWAVRRCLRIASLPTSRWRFCRRR